MNRVSADCKQGLKSAGFLSNLAIMAKDFEKVWRDTGCSSQVAGFLKWGKAMLSDRQDVVSVRPEVSKGERRWWFVTIWISVRGEVSSPERNFSSSSCQSIRSRHRTAAKEKFLASWTPAFAFPGKRWCLPWRRLDVQSKEQQEGRIYAWQVSIESGMRPDTVQLEVQVIIIKPPRTPWLTNEGFFAW